MVQAAPSLFVPLVLDASRWENVQPLYQALMDRAISSADELQAWIIDRGELDAAVNETHANLYITMTCHTDDQHASAAYLRFVEQVIPLIKPVAFELDKRLVAMSTQYPLDENRYGVFLRDTRAEVDLFRDANVPIETELARLGQKFETVSGAMSVVFEGREQTLAQMGRYQEVTDRGVRENAWRTVALRRLQDKDTLSDLYDQMVKLRHQVGVNAGYADFVGYAYKSKHRFDYGVKECQEFHDACEKVVVPFARRQEAKRAAALGVDTLRPWDLAVDVKGRGPLRPFEGGEQLMSKAVATFRRLDPRLGDMLASLGDGSESRGSANGANLDLDSRKGKAPGGYQFMRDRSRKPFIFMNAAGLSRDVDTMLHEAGHAFHSQLCVDEPLLAYRTSPTEFAEVASMSMELLTLPHLGRDPKGSDCFYSDDVDLQRHQRQQIEGSVRLLPWIAMIDAFQHWVYANAAHTREQRTAAWLDLDKRLGSSCSWQGLEQFRSIQWQRQLHLFTHPFYYIEYGIAQLGALQLWLMGLERGERTAVDHYLKGLRLGGSKPLPELFTAAGLKFDFGRDTVARLVERVERELEKLPE